MDLTDRDRLASAFDELKQRGYYAPIQFAWEICCNSCGNRAVDDAWEKGECINPDRYLFWHVQKDDSAFIGEDGVPYPDDIWDAAWADLPEEADDDEIGEHLDQFFDNYEEEHPGELEARMVAERLSKYTMLRGDLYLHWGGDATEIVNVLRKHGLSADLPDKPEGRCIPVFAGTRPV